MNRKRVFHLLLVLLSFLLIEGHAFAKDTQIPTAVGDIYVQDFADVLTEDEENQLKRLGRNLDDQTTAQVAVLTVKTIGEKTISEYANEAFRQYGIGSKEKDNGVLLVLATDDRAVYIEVGYGLEGRIPDGKAGRILDDYTIPNLKNDQPNQAIIKTYEILANEVADEYGITVQQESGNQATTDEGFDFPQWLLIIIIVVLVFLDFKFFGGTLTYFLLSIISRGGRGGGSSGGGPRGGGGGSSGGGGAGRGW